MTKYHLFLKGTLRIAFLVKDNKGDLPHQGLSRAGGFWEDLKKVMQVQEGEEREESSRQSVQRGGKNRLNYKWSGVAGAHGVKQRVLERDEARKENRNEMMRCLVSHLMEL